MSDETFANVPNLIAIFEPLYGPTVSEEGDLFVRLCGDVLLEALLYGHRSQLTKLESVGRNFHWSVEYFFAEKPFLRLGLELIPRDGMYAFFFGNRRSEIPLVNLATLPHFLRFNDIRLYYDRDPASIENKCQLIEDYLQALNETKNDSKSIEFYGEINLNDYTNFRDHSLLLNHLGEQLLPICNSSRCYKFAFSFYSDDEAAIKVFLSILQMPQIKRCSNIGIELYNFEQPRQLPVEAISNWLNRTIKDGVEFIDQSPKKIFLQICLANIQNVMEICDHLGKIFKEATAPTIPYTLKIEDYYGLSFLSCKDDELQNKSTNEELIIRKQRNNILEIKKSNMQKKKKYCK